MLCLQVPAWEIGLGGCLLKSVLAAGQSIQIIESVLLGQLRIVKIARSCKPKDSQTADLPLAISGTPSSAKPSYILGPPPSLLPLCEIRVIPSSASRAGRFFAAALLEVADDY